MSKVSQRRNEFILGSGPDSLRGRLNQARGDIFGSEPIVAEVTRKHLNDAQVEAIWQVALRMIDRAYQRGVTDTLDALDGKLSQASERKEADRG